MDGRRRGRARGGGRGEELRRARPGAARPPAARGPGLGAPGSGWRGGGWAAAASPAERTPYPGARPFGPVRVGLGQAGPACARARPRSGSVR